MNQNKKIYKTEREGQIEFFDNYGIPWEENDGVLVENCDGVYNGVLFEFKLNINDLNKTLFQAVKYLSQMRLKGESVPAVIILVDLNARKAYVYHSEDYRDDIQKVYVGPASKNNAGFSAKPPVDTYDYSDDYESGLLRTKLKKEKTTTEKYMAIDIDENCSLAGLKDFTVKCLRQIREISLAMKKVLQLRLLAKSVSQSILPVLSSLIQEKPIRHLTYRWTA